MGRTTQVAVALNPSSRNSIGSQSATSESAEKVSKHKTQKKVKKHNKHKNTGKTSQQNHNNLGWILTLLGVVFIGAGTLFGLKNKKK